MERQIGFSTPEAWHMTPDQRAHHFKAIYDFGARIVRVGIPWGTYTSGQADGVVLGAIEAGLDPLACIVWPKKQTGIFSTGSSKDFAEFCKMLAVRYPKVRSFELWNEPNLGGFWANGNPKTYSSYLMAGSAAIRSLGNGQKIVSAGLAACGKNTWLWIPLNRDPVDFLAGMYEAKAKDSFDVVAYHPYALSKNMLSLGEVTVEHPMIQNARTIRDLMVSSGDASKPVYWTEAGSSTSVRSEQQQKTDLANIIEMFNRNVYVERMYLHTFRDFPYGKSNSSANIEHRYGIVDCNGNPKPAYETVKSLI